jgi:teichuronic acid biosynthesis glycosyltransferase TuaC
MGYGGNAVYELCSQLVKQHLDVHVVTSSIAGIPNFQILNGIYVHRIPTYYLRLFSTEYPLSPLAFARISKVVDKYTDLLHANFEIFQTTFVSGIVKKFKRKPMVLTMHGQGRTTNSSYGSIMLNAGYSVNHNIIERLTVHSADKIIALTPAVRFKALRLGVDSEKISLIPNGVNTERYRPLCLDQKYYEDLKIVADCKVICFIGRLHPTHGIFLLLDAIPKILKEYPRAIFVLVGDGPLRSYVLAFLRSHDLCNHVRLLGYREDIPQLLNVADIVIYPALSVGMPLTILEAMGCGKTVVAFDIDGNREIIVNGQTGILVREITANAVASSVTVALSNPNYLIDIGNNARRQVERSFSWRTVSSKVIDIYKELVDA